MKFLLVHESIMYIYEIKFTGKNTLFGNFIIIQICKTSYNFLKEHSNLFEH